MFTSQLHYNLRVNNQLRKGIAVIKVMIIDDEPFIREGLKVIIDWQKYGFQVCEEAGNGRQALEKLKKQDIGLIIADIRMPEMNGLELIEYVRKHYTKKIYFIILSGYNDFEYAKQAISNDVSDYLLKPIQAEELIRSIEKIKAFIHEEQNKEQAYQKLMEGRIKSVLQSIVLGKASEQSIEATQEQLGSKKLYRYCLIRMKQKDNATKLSAKGKNEGSKRVEKAFQNNFPKTDFYLLEYQSINDETLEVGVVLVNIRENNLDFYAIDRIHLELKNDPVFQYHYFIGIQVESLEKLSLSYKTAIKASVNLVLGEVQPDICSYEKQNRKTSKRYAVPYKSILSLQEAVKENRKDELKQIIQSIFKDFEEHLLEIDLIQTNIRYILYNIVDIAKTSLPESEEIDTLLSPKIIEKIAYQADINKCTEEIISFSDYYYQLKHYASTVTLSKIITEIDQNYMNNISLLDLSKKYFMNNVYLGQRFKKEKGMTFKEYLNKIRIDKAAEILLHSNERIYSIAEMVGFQTPDYFINKFVQLKGTTPHQYRMKYTNK